MNVPRARSNVPATQLTKPALKAALAATFGERPKTAQPGTSAPTALAYPRARMNVLLEKRSVPTMTVIACAVITTAINVPNGERPRTAASATNARTAAA